MNHLCHPDLPFWQTVAWYGKQILAVVIVLVAIGAVVVTVLMIEEWYTIRKRFKKKEK
jgi:uncharacterized membrane protein